MLREGLINMIHAIETDKRFIRHMCENNNICDLTSKIVKLEEIVLHIHQIDDCFQNRSQISNGKVVLYRGTRSDMELGINTGYISTSKSIKYILESDFISNNCCIYEYKLAKGVPYLDLSEISSYPDQQEVLLPRGLIAELKRSEIVNGFKIYHVEIQLPDSYVLPIIELPDKDIFITQKYIHYFNTNIQEKLYKILKSMLTPEEFEKVYDYAAFLFEDMIDTDHNINLVISKSSYYKICTYFLEKIYDFLGKERIYLHNHKLIHNISSNKSVFRKMTNDKSRSKKTLKKYVSTKSDKDKFLLIFYDPLYYPDKFV